MGFERSGIVAQPDFLRFGEIGQDCRDSSRISGRHEGGRARCKRDHAGLLVVVLALEVALALRGFARE